MDPNETTNPTHEATEAAQPSTNPDADIKPSTAQIPFDNQDGDADLILRTCDKVDFYVHKIFLRKASPIFADMFAVARHEQSLCHDTDQQLPFPVVDVEESGSTMNSILRICYPVDETKQTSLDNVIEVLKAALKYEMPKATTHMKQELLTYIPTDPISVYARACTLNLEDEACQAAKELRKQMTSHRSSGYCSSCGSYLPDETSQESDSFQRSVGGKAYRDTMRQNTAGHFFRLISYVKSGVHTTFCSSPPRNEECPTLPKQSHDHLPNPDIIIQSADRIDLPAHTFVLNYASTSLDWLDSPTEHSPEGLPVIHLDEDGNTLGTLLRLCYPFAHYDVTSETCTVSHISYVRKTAEKYEMSDVTRVARDVLVDHIDTHPMQVYFAASRWGWEREIRFAKHQCLTLSESNIEGPKAYVTEMEFVSAEVYYHLLKSWYEAKEEPKSISSTWPGGKKRGGKYRR